MSQEISKELRLLGLVANHPPEDRKVCALDRAGAALGLPNTPALKNGTYCGLGGALGFTYVETGALMSGWDEASGRCPKLGAYENSTQGTISAAYTLGVKCWEIAQKR